ARLRRMRDSLELLAEAERLPRRLAPAEAAGWPGRASPAARPVADPAPRPMDRAARDLAAYRPQGVVVALRRPGRPAADGPRPTGCRQPSGSMGLGLPDPGGSRFPANRSAGRPVGQDRDGPAGFSRREPALRGKAPLPHGLGLVPITHPPAEGAG